MAVSLAAPSSAKTTEPVTAQGDFAWFYTQQNYGGSAYSYYSTERGIKVFPQPINSVIAFPSGYREICGLGGYGSQAKYGFEAGKSYAWIGAPFSASDPLLSAAPNGTFVGVDPTGAALFIEC
ncbi:hypothetical protein [Streptomyces sp. GC420]|uniref:hypothetical protein n=1 Tax=Streptomyces sp. GC420 TaxID=2697568 RepID=UPI001414F20F|nr:hypothetical protein [Streptomyces sp. GC420]NBM15946.1 hypothetical protein [Streptomyces sp. GC420]